MPPSGGGRRRLLRRGGCRFRHARLHATRGGLLLGFCSRSHAVSAWCEHPWGLMCTFPLLASIPQRRLPPLPPMHALPAAAAAAAATPILPPTALLPPPCRYVVFTEIMMVDCVGSFKKAGHSGKRRGRQRRGGEGGGDFRLPPCRPARARARSPPPPLSLPLPHHRCQRVPPGHGVPVCGCGPHCSAGCSGALDHAVGGRRRALARAPCAAAPGGHGARRGRRCGAGKPQQRKLHAGFRAGC